MTASAGAAGQLASNALNQKPLGDGVAMAAAMGAIGGGGGGEIAGELEAEVAQGAQGAERAAAKDLVGEGAAICGLSFAAQTPVQTPQGERPIATLQVGDTVQVYDPTSKRVTTRHVAQVWITQDSDRLDVTLVAERSVTIPATYEAPCRTESAPLTDAER